MFLNNESNIEKRKRKFDDTFTKTNFLLKIMGVDMKKTSKIFSVKNLWLYLMNLIWLYMDAFGEFCWFINGLREGKSFDELSFVAPLFTICILSTVKSVTIFLNKNIVIEIVEKLQTFYLCANDDEDNQGKLHNRSVIETGFEIDKDFNHKLALKRSFHSNITETIDKNKEYRKEASRGKTDTLHVEIDKVLKIGVDNFNLANSWFLFACYSAAPSFLLLPLALMGFDYFKNSEVIFRLPFFVDYLFFDPYEKKLWPFIYFHQIWSTIIVSAAVLGTDTLFFAFCSHLRIQFKILGLKFENLVQKKQKTDEVKRKLFLLVQKHQDLIELVNNVDSIYTTSVLFNFITSSFLMCLSAFNITTVNNLGTIFSFLTFLIMSLTQIFLLCYCGDMVMTSSKDIGNYVYNCRWYLIDDKLKKCLFIVLYRARKPCKLTAAHFSDLNLPAFTTVLSRSWSYFALLKTIYN